MSFSKYLKLYFLITSKYIQSKMAYRVDFVISTIGIFFMNTIDLATIWIVLQSIQSIGGWNYHQLMFLYGFSLLSLLPAQLFFNNFWNLKNYVREGTFIKYYLKPINMMFCFVSEVIDINGFAQGVIGFVLIIWSSIQLNYQWTLQQIGVFIFLVSMSSLIMISLLIISASTGFWIVNSDSVMTLAFNFKDFVRYPLTIFNKFFRYFFTFVLPIGYISFYPVEFLINQNQDITNILLLPVIGLLLFSFAYYVFDKGTKSYSGTGS